MIYLDNQDVHDKDLNQEIVRMRESLRTHLKSLNDGEQRAFLRSMILAAYNAQQNEYRRLLPNEVLDYYINQNARNAKNDKNLIKTGGKRRTKKSSRKSRKSSRKSKRV